jgi:glycosyltransferase involved in cell wall biosynthesis
MNQPNGIAAHKDGILLVTGSLDYGGTERHIALIAPALRRAGLDVSIYCLSGPGAFAEEVAAQGVPIHESPGSARRPSRARTPYRLVRDLQSLARTMRFAQPRIAHFFLPYPYMVGSMAAASAQIPIRIMSRRSLNIYQQKYPGAAEIEQRLHRRMHLILANSQRVAQQLREEEGVPASKLGLIYNGVDLRRFALPKDRAAVRQRIGLAEDALVLAIVANLIPYKGHLDLLEGLAAVRDQLPKPWRLLVVGRDDGNGAGLVTAAHKLGIVGNLRFLGARADVPELLAAADIGILCSHQEGFSNAIIEGMASGLPMVVTDVGGNAEAVIDGDCGLVVPAHTPEALGAAIARLAGDAHLRQTMGRAALARAQDEFSLEACVAKYVRLYGALIAGQPAHALEGLGRERPGLGL